MGASGGSMTATASQYAAGLRDLADWLEANEDVIGSDLYEGELTAFPEDEKDTVRAWAKAMAPCEKQYPEMSPLFRLVKDFGPVKLRAVFDREAVCTRVVTTETVTKTIPDPAFTPDVPMIEVTEAVQHVEWICDPVLAEEKV